MLSYLLNAMLAVLARSAYPSAMHASMQSARPLQKLPSLTMQAIQPLLKEISRTKPDVQEDTFEDPAEQDVSTPRSTSLMNQAAEGMRALGSFFAQAAMGGAEVCSLQSSLWL